MAANESDIVEAFVRHTLGLLDGLVVLDHSSSDRTPEILRSLAQEGLALVVWRDNDRAFRQGERQTQMAKRYLAELQADFCFILDADELVKVASRADLEAALAALPEGHTGAVAMQNYVVMPDAPQELNPVQRIPDRLRSEAKAVHKVVVRRDFAAAADEHVSLGNHAAVRVRDGKVEPLRHARVEGVHLAHYPVRSPQQIAKKALLGWLSHRLAVGAAGAATMTHWRHLFDELASGRAAIDEDLVRRANAWYLKGSADPVAITREELVHDPLACGYALRYTTPEAPAPIAALATWASQLVTDLTAPRT